MPEDYARTLKHVVKNTSTAESKNTSGNAR